jgi:addiction module RelB/DinJ family antitoxin
MATTTLLIKTDKKLKTDAQRLSKSLGIPLTTAVNAMLRGFVRDQKIVLDNEPRVKDEKMMAWKKAFEETDFSKEKRYTSVEDLFKDMGI